MIIAAIVLSPLLAIPAMSLAWGVLIAGMIQLAWVWWALTPVGRGAPYPEVTVLICRVPSPEFSQAP